MNETIHSASPAPLEHADPALIAEILAVVVRRTGVDFSGFRTATVRRRIFTRMLSTRSASLRDYLALLERSEPEGALLLERITIKVSRFYRNRRTFDRLRADVMPRLAALGRPVRLWCAGSACGEEACTLAMLLDEAGVPGSVLATDIDEGALALARRGIHPEDAAAELPPDLRARYLVPASLRQRPALAVAPGLRDRVVFERHDLLSLVPPRPRPFDLVSCRNVLIYLERALAERVQAALRGAVAAGGFLCLGKAEWPAPAVLASLQTLDARGRLFRATEAG